MLSLFLTTVSNPSKKYTAHEHIDLRISSAESVHTNSGQIFKCEYCDRSYNRNTKLEDHVNKEHDFVGLIDFTKCGLCGEIFGRSSTLARHISSPHNFPCVYCDLKFQSKPILTKHRKNCARFKVIGIIEDCLNSVII